LKSAQKLLARFSIRLLLLGGLAGCATSIDSIGADGSSASPPLPVGFEQWLTLRCPDDHYLEIQNRVTGEVIASPPCTEVRAVALADERTRGQMFDLFRTQQAVLRQSPPDSRLGEAKEPGLVGALLGLAASAYLGYKCEQQHVGWAECWAAGVPIWLVLLPFPF
jgi:hypothetical protein